MGFITLVCVEIRCVGYTLKIVFGLARRITLVCKTNPEMVQEKPKIICARTSL